MAGDRSKKSAVDSSNPPRKLNVQKFAESRAPELETLHTIVSNRLNNDFRSKRNKRRRTTAHDNKASKKRCRKKRKLGLSVAVDDNSKNDVSEDKVLPRYIRRRIELRKNGESEFSCSGDGTKWLRTHVWHAKRFCMVKRWGFHLPLGLQGRGRGSRSLLKRYKHGVVLHDASYFSAVQLEGPEDSLLSVLTMVLEPSPSCQPEEVRNAIISGAIYGSAMLHHVGAPFSQLIAPVTYMWQPTYLSDAENGGNKHVSDRCIDPRSSESCSLHRQLWVWIHASAFSEGYDNLKSACQKQMTESGALINCLSLEGQLAKLEVMGSKAFRLLQKILHPVSCSSRNSWELKKCTVEEPDCESEFNEPSMLDIKENIPSFSVLSFMVRDPRAFPEERIPDLTSAVPIVENYVSDYKPVKDDTIQESPEKMEELFSSSKPKQSCSLPDKQNLWEARSRATLPVDENVLCLAKHHSRLNFVCLNDPKPRALCSSTEVQGSKSCPIMLLNNNNRMGSFIGWSIIIPLSWAKVFWISFISKGACAIGLREKQWIACEVGLPVFPLDFPDSNAYSSYMESVCSARGQKAEQIPASMRPLKVPIPQPWNVIRIAVDQGCIALQSAPDCDVNVATDCNLSSIRSYGNSFSGIVARMPGVLTNFLNEIDSDQLILFPKVPNGKMNLIELMKDEKLGLLQNGISEVILDRKLCFVRVLLHAYKEGVFEEGAVICAPCPSDLSLWTSRSEKSEIGFQITQSSVGSFFKEQASGKWELELPKDPVARESYRWPIGFVTTGFVRGSKKPIAQALCEAVLLARLREQQWREIPVKQRRKEIYVLVRNLRSTAYRLGLASIVLEQQEDLEFL